jgi:outer membrane biogenesis lipoprotein LolB
MKQLSSRVAVAALAIALLAAPAAAFSREPDPVPDRNANVWDWRAHQPTQAQVERKENAAGVAPTQSQRDSGAATVDQLYRQLLSNSRS